MNIQRRPLIERTRNRIRSLPGVAADLRDRLFPGTFVELLSAVRPYTMCTTRAIRGLYRGIRHVARHGVRGDLVECGAALGGSAAFLGLGMARCGGRRPLWVFDTFEGLPPPTTEDPDYAIAVQFAGSCRGTIEQVGELLGRLGVADARLVKGPVEDTLAGSDVKQIALLHIDTDWYKSVKTCLQQLYHRVAPGGVVQFDDYGYWEGARRAVDEFLASLPGQRPRLRFVDYSSRQIVKPTVRS